MNQKMGREQRELHLPPSAEDVARETVIAPGPDLESPFQAGQTSRLSYWMPQSSDGVPLEEVKRAAEESSAPVSYFLVRPVAEGGCGEVWEAVQSSLGRVIAVKRILPKRLERAEHRPGESRRLTWDFQQEAVLTANLDHPNIVPVHDLGRDSEGNPLLAMKLVRGTRWDVQLREDFAMLPVVDFLSKHLRVLVAVAQAVAFAHSRGIIHRDIKPSQVMVGEFAEVLLMDWGLAMVYEEELLPPALRLSAWGTGLPTRKTAPNPSGTPAFMAPEQTEKGASRLGPWTDTFLLGATLYEMLVGFAPFQASSAERAFILAAECRFVPPAEKNPGREAPEELIAVCRRAMHPDPKERHPSVLAFVADLEDYLTGAVKRRESMQIVCEVHVILNRDDGTRADYESLESCASALLRASALWPENLDAQILTEQVLTDLTEACMEHKDLRVARVYARRLGEGAHRESLLARIAEAEKLQHRRERQRHYATAAAAVLLTALVTLGGRYAMDLRVARDNATQARSDAEETINFMLGDLRRRLEPIGSLPVLDDIGGQALNYFTRLPAAKTEPETMRHHAQAHLLMGQVREGQGAAEEALSSFSEARRLCRNALAITPQDEALNETSGEALASMGRVLLAQGRVTEAREVFAEALIVQRFLVGRNPLSASRQLALAQGTLTYARTLEAQGMNEEALAAHRDLVASLEKTVLRRPDDAALAAALAESHGGIGRVLQYMGKMEEARAEFESQLGILERLTASAPADTGVRHKLSAALRTLGGAEEYRGNLDAAEECFSRSLALMEGLVGADQSNAAWQSDLSVALNSLGRVARTRGKLDESLELYRRSLAIRAVLAKQDPSNAVGQRDHSISLRAVAGILELQGHLDDAVAHYALSLETMESVARANPDNALWQLDLSWNYSHLGRVLLARGEVDLAAAPILTCLELRTGIIARDPGNGSWLRDVGQAWRGVAALAAASGDDGLRRIAADEGERAARELVDRDASNTTWVVDLAEAELLLAETAAEDGNPQLAEAQVEQARARLEELLKSEPNNVTWQVALAEANLQRGRLLANQCRSDDARQAFEQALRLNQAIVAHDPGNAAQRFEGAVATGWLGQLALEHDRLAEAKELIAQALDVQQELAGLSTSNAPWRVERARLHGLMAETLAAEGDPTGAEKQRRFATVLLQKLLRSGYRHPELARRSVEFP